MVKVSTYFICHQCLEHVFIVETYVRYRQLSMISSMLFEVKT